MCNGSGDWSRATNINIENSLGMVRLGCMRIMLRYV
jgi:hypothetical protein